eukprot:1069642-Lingulodinium_polyedra.AAC.1
MEDLKARVPGGITTRWFVVAGLGHILLQARGRSYPGVRFSDAGRVRRPSAADEQVGCSEVPANSEAW